MKKIMFNDKFLLTEAVLAGRKTQTRRIPKIQPPYKNSQIAFPICDSDDEDSPLWLAYCWVNKDNENEFTKWVKPMYKEGEIVAIAQSYKDCGGLMSDGTPRWDYISQIVGNKNEGWRNKMYIKPELMPHQILIKKVKIQRLQDISEKDCLAEGIVKRFDCKGYPYYKLRPDDDSRADIRSAKEAYAALIDRVSGKGTWERNPWVWVYEFELVK